MAERTILAIYEEVVDQLEDEVLRLREEIARRNEAYWSLRMLIWRPSDLDLHAGRITEADAAFKVDFP